MTLLNRSVRLGKRLVKGALRRGAKLGDDMDDARLRRSLSSRSRAPRSSAPIDDLASQSVLLVVAHPDDEAIAAGMLLARLPKAGVICVTNGAPRKEAFARAAGFDNWLDYAHARRGETEAALALLNRPIAPLQNWGLSDQDAILNLTPLARALVKPMRSGFSRVVTHAYEGGHPDHDAVAFAVHAACALIAKEGLTPPVVLEAPLYNAPHGRFVHQAFIPHPDAGPILSLRYSPAEQDLKRRMYGCYETQNSTFKDFGVEEETFRLAPRYHFALPPHAGEVGYNQFNWALDGKAWRAHAWRAMRELGVLEELA